MEQTNLIATIIVGFLTIAAILVGPILALHIQRKLDEDREHKRRQLSVFKTLMTYRATPININFVQALNLIELEFDSEAERDIRDAWKVLLDQLQEDHSKPEVRQKTGELTAELLYVMGKSLNYTFDKVYLKKGAYYPQGLGWIEEESHELRRKMLDVLKGQNRFPVAVFTETFPFTALEEVQEAAQKTGAD